MSTKIRMQRTGSRNHPAYRVVVTDSRSPRDGRFIEKVGFYNPTATPVLIQLEEERIEYWLEHGATPSDSVKALFKRQKQGKLEELTGKPKAKERKAAAKAAAAAASAKETAAEATEEAASEDA